VVRPSAISVSADGSDADPSCYPSPTMAAAKLTKKDLDDFTSRLRDERAELSEQLTTIEDQAFAATQSDISGDVGVDDESADAGTATFEREKELSIEQNVRDLIQKIDRALKRIDAGTYGICERCGKPIEKARLKALPYVDLCIKDAQARSRR
jgi:RNA polymerase-binding protein DksA